MFSRYALHSNIDEIKDLFKAVAKFEFPTSYNIGVGSEVPIVISGHARETTVVMATWDSTFAGVSAKTSAIDMKTINKSKELRKAFQRKRCIIPINGYYEWKKLSEKITIPFYLRMINTDILGVAGIYSTQTDPDGNTKFEFTVILVSANELVEPLNETMPALLPEGMFDQWLDPLQTDVELLEKALKPAPTSDMASFRISNKVDDVEANSPELIHPVM
jgi:putative SOS response-associated peptidase YedK